MDEDAYARQNAREVIVAVRLPRSRSIRIGVKTNANAFRRVTLETLDLAYDKTADGIAVVIPPQIVDRINPGEFQTHFYWPALLQSSAGGVKMG